MNMRKICFLFFSVVMAGCSSSQSELRFRPDGKFVIMQMTDLS
jgi:uncharacterized protein YcfL